MLDYNKLHLFVTYSESLIWWNHKSYFSNKAKVVKPIHVTNIWHSVEIRYWILSIQENIEALLS